jgi:three-Cys-motif partner protein
MVVKASDGLKAREAGAWTKEKLTYLRKYAEGFMKAMSPKRDEGRWNKLIYIDPLCGSGKCVAGSDEFDGSPLIALRIRPAFDHLYLSDRSPQNISVLKKRISEADYQRVSCKSGDCKTVVNEVIRSFPERTLGLAFVDPEGFEVDFTVLKALASRPIDILYFFPSMIGVKRNLRQAFVQKGGRLDSALGPDWRNVPAAKLAAGKQPNEKELSNFDTSLIHYLRRQVRELGLIHQDNSPPVFRNEQNAPMYHLLFFSKNAAGLKIWNGIKRIDPGGQRSFSGKGF